MNRARERRIAKVRHAIDASPVRRHLLNEAYESFTMFGELDEDDHVAFEVVEKALRGGADAPVETEDKVAERAKKARLAYHERSRPSETWPPSVRGMIFDEALFEGEPIRNLARAAIALEVAHGGDVESPGFMARHGIPGYGSVAMHVMRLQDWLSAAPYEYEATRLFVRLDNLRGSIDHDDPRWFTVQGKAIAAFYRTGELPTDDLHLEGVLVSVGIDMLRAHRSGKKVGKGIELLSKLERARGAEFEALLEKFGAFVQTKQPF